MYLVTPTIANSEYFRLQENHKSELNFRNSYLVSITEQKIECREQTLHAWSAPLPNSCTLDLRLSTLHTHQKTSVASIHNKEHLKLRKTMDVYNFQDSEA